MSQKAHMKVKFYETSDIEIPLYKYNIKGSRQSPQLYFKTSGNFNILSYVSTFHEASQK